MEIKEMTLKDVETRLAECDTIRETSQNAEEIEALAKEVEELEARKVELADLEERKADAEKIRTGEVTPEVIESRKEENVMKTIEEFRNSKEYVDAYAEYIKSGNDEEIRSLLTTNVGDAGEIAVPSFVYDEIKTAWDRNEIMSLVNKINVAGNMQVQFEISGSDAVIHDEGSGAVSEETLTEGIVTLVPKDIIKWISISREAKAMRGEQFVRYCYRELTHKILKKAADELIAKIAALPTSATSTTPSAAKVKLGAAVGTVVSAIGNLSDDASNPTIVMNKLSYAAVKNAAYGAGYSIDPFEGLEVRYNSTLPAYDSATENQVWMIVGDFGYGAMANFPEGQVPIITIDEVSKRKQGMIDIVGDMMVAAEPIACKAFTLVTKPASL